MIPLLLIVRYSILLLIGDGYPYIANPANPSQAEIYNPSTGNWNLTTDTPFVMSDCVFAEMGPAILRPDGTVFALSGSTFTNGSAIYDYRTQTWITGPSLPTGEFYSRYRSGVTSKR